MSEFNGKKSLNLRVWHWLNFLVICGLLITYLLRKTVLAYKTNAVILQSNLASLGISLEDKDAAVIAKIFRDNMWVWHENLGVVFVLLLIWRFYAFVTKKDSFPLPARNASSEFNRAKLAHALFFVVAIYVAISGVLLMFRQDLGIAKESLSLVKTLHKFSVWFFVAFTVGHLFGVIKAEITSSKGLISEMFHGKIS